MRRTGRTYARGWFAERAKGAFGPLRVLDPLGHGVGQAQHPLAHIILGQDLILAGEQPIEVITGAGTRIHPDERARPFGARPAARWSLLPPPAAARRFSPAHCRRTPGQPPLLRTGWPRRGPIADPGGDIDPRNSR